MTNKSTSNGDGDGERDSESEGEAIGCLRGVSGAMVRLKVDGTR